MKNIESILKEVPLFELLPDTAIVSLVDEGEMLSFAADTVVCEEGAETDGLYVILEGHVRIYKRVGDDHDVELLTMQGGDFFGEMALIDSQRRSASVATTTPCTLFRLEKSAFLSLMAACGDQTISASLFTSLVTRIRTMTEKYYDEELVQRTLEAEMKAKQHRMMAQMVAGVAHELNTPLGIVNTAVNMIETRVSSERFSALVENAADQQGVVDDIRVAARLAQRNIRRANKLVENFKKISVNQLTETLEIVNISTLLEDILDLFKINARQSNLKIELVDSVSPEQKVWQGYPGHLTQIVTNLLFNIERYAYPQSLGPQSLGPQPLGGKICIELRAGEDLFLLKVQDFGRGIAEDHLDQVFEPFFTTGRTRGGTGLGLAIVKNIVTEALQGSIELESTLGKGTAVSVSFP